jgi:hypothetical protein
MNAPRIDMSARTGGSIAMTTVPTGSPNTGADVDARTTQAQAAAADVPGGSTEIDSDADSTSAQTLAAGDEAPAEG